MHLKFTKDPEVIRLSAELNAEFQNRRRLRDYLTQVTAMELVCPALFDVNNELGKYRRAELMRCIRERRPNELKVLVEDMRPQYEAALMQQPRARSARPVHGELPRVPVRDVPKQETVKKRYM